MFKKVLKSLAFIMLKCIVYYVAFFILPMFLLVWAKSSGIISFEIPGIVFRLWGLVFITGGFCIVFSDKGFAECRRELRGEK